MVTSENVGVGDAAKAGVTTYTSDGKPVAHYSGSLIDVSPSGDRILNAEDTWIDLHSGKTVHFTWSSGATPERWLPIWSPDETRVYFCCYFYGDARTGASYTISDENTIFDGHKWDGLHDLHHSHGVWLKDGYILAQFDALFTGPADFIPIFDPNARTFRDFGKMAGVPAEYNDSYITSISPNGDYLFVRQGANETGYLVDLKTFKSQVYSDYAYPHWSANGKYAIIGSQVFSLASKILRPLPVMPFFGISEAWHPTRGVDATIVVDKENHQTLYLFDVEALSYRQFALPSNFIGTYMDSAAIIWNPNGNLIVLRAADGSLWQIDYPKLEKLEQLTPPMADVKDILWSPDGTHLSFVSGSDIYIVESKSNP